MSKIVVNDNGSNTLLQLRPLSRLYCGYANNVNETVSVQDVFERFPNSSEALVVYRIQDFTTTGSNKFTYTGSIARWFDVTAVCNALKGTGNALARNISFQWSVNGVLTGSERQAEMNPQTSMIVTDRQKIRAGICEHDLVPNPQAQAAPQP